MHFKRSISKIAEDIHSKFLKQYIPVNIVIRSPLHVDLRTTGGHTETDQCQNIKQRLMPKEHEGLLYLIKKLVT